MKTILHIICLFIVFLPVSGQNKFYPFKHLTNENGLSSANINCLLRDSYGYLWIGTDNGLNKYDGYTFALFKKEQGNLNSLFDNNCLAIYEDKNHSIWIATRFGLCLYNKENNTFRRYPFKIKEKTENIDIVLNTITQDHDGNLLIGTSIGIFQFDIQTKQLKNKIYTGKYAKNLPNTKISTLLFDKKGNLWISVDNATKGGVYQVNNNKIIKYFHNKNGLSSNYIDKIFIDKDQNVWVATRGFGIDRISSQDNSIKLFTDKNTIKLSEGLELIKSIAQAPNGDIWISSMKGIIIIDPKTYKISKTESALNDPNSLVSNDINVIYFDKEGTAFVGSRFGGLDYYNPQFNNFQKYTTYNNLTHNNITAITEDKDSYIWIGTDGGGLNRFNPKTKQIKHFSTQEKIKGLTNNKTLSVAVDKNNDLWVGMWLGGISRYHIENGNLTLIKHYSYLDKDNLNSHSPFYIFEAKDNKIWIGSWNCGLYYYDRKLDKFISQPLQTSKNEEFYVDYLFEDDKQNIWVCTENLGVYKFNYKTNQTTHYYISDNDSTTLSVPSISCGKQDSYGNIWLGTSSSGLCLYNAEKDNFIQFNKEIEITGSSIAGIQEDNNSNIWLSSNRGITKLSLKYNNNSKMTLQWNKFTKTDGLQADQFNKWASFKSKSGHIYMGGIKGFNVFYPDSMIHNTRIIPVYITGINFITSTFTNKFDTEINKTLIANKQIKIPYSLNSFTINFVGINLIFPEKNRYKCTLEGFNNEWINLGTKREITFSNIPPGQYTFRVLASNNDGIWNNKGATLTIIILTPWWMSWWFIVICVIISISIPYVIIKLRMSYYHHKEKELNKLVDNRTKELVESNAILLEQQTKIEEQQKELKNYAQSLKESNEELIVNQEVINNQKEELATTNEQLLAINSTKDKLFSILAHDLKSPFNAILGFSELLYENIEENPIEKSKKQVSTIRDAARRTFNLLDNLLQWSRAQRGIIDFDPVTISMKDFIEMQLELIQAQATSKEILFSTLEIGQPKHVKADENMLSAIVRNLASNAIKYSHSGDIVKIELNYLEEHFLFSIKDTGVGMSEEYRKTIFSLANLESKAGTAGEKGTGLGLVLCADFIARHGGRIWVESEKDKGSTFFFTLPYVK